MIYSKGISWIDDCRIPFVDTEHIDFNTTQNGKVYGRNSLNESITERNTTHYTTKGRFTPNLLVCDDMLNDGSVSKSVKGGKGKPLTNHNGITDKMLRPDTIQERGGFDDKGTNSRYYNLDLWFDNMLDKL